MTANNGNSRTTTKLKNGNIKHTTKEDMLGAYEIMPDGTMKRATMEEVLRQAEAEGTEAVGGYAFVPLDGGGYRVVHDNDPFSIVPGCYVGDAPTLKEAMALATKHCLEGQKGSRATGNR